MPPWQCPSPSYRSKASSTLIDTCLVWFGLFLVFFKWFLVTRFVWLMFDSTWFMRSSSSHYCVLFFSPSLISLVASCHFDVGRRHTVLQWEAPKSPICREVANQQQGRRFKDLLTRLGGNLLPNLARLGAIRYTFCPLCLEKSCMCKFNHITPCWQGTESWRRGFWRLATRKPLRFRKLCWKLLRMAAERFWQEHRTARGQRLRLWSPSWSSTTPGRRELFFFPETQNS